MDFYRGRDNGKRIKLAFSLHSAVFAFFVILKVVAVIGFFWLLFQIATIVTDRVEESNTSIVKEAGSFFGEVSKEFKEGMEESK